MFSPPHVFSAGSDVLAKEVLCLSSVTFPPLKSQTGLVTCWVLTEQAKLEAFHIRPDLQKSVRWIYGHVIAVCVDVLFCFIVKP